MKIKAVVFDADGVVINSPGYFSVQYQKEFGVSGDVMLSFFKGKFQECLVGKADLREELEHVLEDWGWKGTVDELLVYWFKSEHYIDERVVNEIKRLRTSGIKCYLGTKQEKYRTQYIKKDMGFENFFDEIYSSADLGYNKSDKKFYESISQDLSEKENINPQEIMFWDDDQENVDVANESGWSAFFYTSFEKFQDKIKEV